MKTMTFSTHCSRLFALARVAAVLLAVPGAHAQIPFRAATTGLNGDMAVQWYAVGAVACGTGTAATPGAPTRRAGELLLTIVVAGDHNAITKPSSGRTRVHRQRAEHGPTAGDLLGDAAHYMTPPPPPSSGWRVLTNGEDPTTSGPHLACR